ncbi:hypothetical protein [Flavobacterium tegetincola]|uniref:hypothetical protein n=1 Tax=Flavobacterium tegetincola TaxID=150172 RepID=UPI0004162F73|nr:hypothetical protein [Flavobacterium tegetincola]
MKKSTPIFIALASILLLSCKENKETPKVTYENTTKTEIKTVPIDSSQIAIADLPIQMEGTSYLIHPIGDFRVYEGRSKSTYGTSNTDKVSFSVSNYNRFELTGFLQNLKFQHIDSTEIRFLTDKKVMISNVSYLNTIFEKSKRQLLVYSIIDMDTNRDKNLDANDIKSLYISAIDGTNFTKLSATMQELIDWNLVESKNRLYFRTIEDTNQNGQFDKNDRINYHFVDLLSTDFKTESYNPI